MRGAILDWYAVAHRQFPWRGTRDPYAVLVSEVMLQQTQASRVADRFPRFMARFPTAEALAEADAASVLAEWSGLGYNRRAVALQQAARTVVADGWPTDVEALERLPGIGPYTARAVASLAFGQRVGVVDTNVRRWLVRRFGAPEANPLQALSDQLASLDAGDSADWTHASMEFGAAVCRSRTPLCEACPLAPGCPSRDRADRVPVRRQPSFPGSRRAYRGALLRLLAEAPEHVLGVAAARRAISQDAAPTRPFLGDEAWAELLAALEREGLVARDGARLRLGGTRRVESAA